VAVQAGFGDQDPDFFLRLGSGQVSGIVLPLSLPLRGEYSITIRAFKQKF
jgi:hypothetical protein